jgi:hypothetical protein
LPRSEFYSYWCCMYANSFVRSVFHSLIAFGQLDFQPSTANAFLMDVALYWFIYLRTPISGMLQNHQVLGSHSDVYFLYGSGQVEHIIWSHPGIRPFGSALPIQCSCKALKSFVPTSELNPAKSDLQLVRLTCKNPLCSVVLEYVKPPSFQRVMNGKWARSEVGEWYVEKLLPDL